MVIHMALGLKLRLKLSFRHLISIRRIGKKLLGGDHLQACLHLGCNASEKWCHINHLYFTVHKYHFNLFFLCLVLIPTLTVVVRVVHSHSMLRLGIQGLMPQGNCWLVYCIVDQKQDGKWKKQTC